MAPTTSRVEAGHMGLYLESGAQVAMWSLGDTVGGVIGRQVSRTCFDGSLPGSWAKCFHSLRCSDLGDMHDLGMEIF